MVGALSIVGSSVMDSHTGPCLCVDALPSTKSGGGDVVLWKNLMGRKQHLVKHGGRTRTMELSSSFTDPGKEWKLKFSRSCKKQQGGNNRRVNIVNELGGQYEDTFEDVKAVHNHNFSG